MSIHKAVLLKEAIESLRIKNGRVVVDATLGGGGHSDEILKIIGSKGKLVAIDADIKAIKNYRERIKSGENLFLVNDNFVNLEKILDSLKIEKVDAILADFGLSSDQLEKSGRGFSFLRDEPLDMRIRKMENDERGDKLKAEDVVNKYSENELINILYKYGEEKYAVKIVREIIENRKSKEIKTTLELVDIISEAVPEKYKHQKIHFATRTFQAIRMEVNQELAVIEKFIKVAINRLSKEGRLAVISFHSGEDRLVKNIFREESKDCICPDDFPICQCDKEAVVKIITKRPIISSHKEILNNTRARSAKMRVLEKI